MHVDGEIRNILYKTLADERLNSSIAYRYKYINIHV